MQTRYQMPVNGMEVQQSDLNLLGQVSALADDAVLSELLRLIPLASTGNPPTKATMPYGNLTPQLRGASIVSTTGSNNGSVQIYPFRAFVGSRITINPSIPSTVLTNWNDMRSAVYVGASSLSTTQAIAPNSSGNPRWDLIYAAVSVDANGASVTRFVKDPTSKIVNSQSVTTTLVTSITIGLSQGTPGATPVRPTLPTDAGGVYYIPLAFIRVPNGNTSTTTYSAHDIQDVAPTVPISRTTGAGSMAPANQSSGTANAVSGFTPNTVLTREPWSLTAGQLRPPAFIPPTMIGSESIFVMIDRTTLHGGPSHVSGDVVDNSRDWRGRFFLTAAQSGASGDSLATAFPWGTANPSSAQRSIPDGLPATGTSVVLGNSYAYDQWTRPIDSNPNSQLVIFLGSPSSLPGMAANSQIILYVDATTGAITFSEIGSGGAQSNVCFFFWIMATAQLPF